MPKKEKITFTCLNPSCRKVTVAGHYGRLQKVCSGSYVEQCIKKCPGKTCRRCLGKKKYKATCSSWYRRYWSQVRKPPRGMSDDDQTKILKFLEKQDPLFWSFVIAARNSALRKGELLGVTWADIEDGGKIRSNFPLRGQWDDRVGFKETKTGNGRIAFFFKEVRDALTKIRTSIAKGAAPSDRIWPYTEVTTWEMWTTLQKKMKIFNPDTGRPYRVHDLRHVSALRALKKNGRLSDASTLCGHKSPATTSIYTQQRPEDFVASLDGNA